MPGYTKKQLAANGAKVTHYSLCRRCGRYWHKASFKRHVAVHNKLVVKLEAPPAPKRKKGDVFVMHPAWKQSIDDLAKMAVKQWLAEQSRRSEAEAATAPGAQPAARGTVGPEGDPERRRSSPSKR